MSDQAQIPETRPPTTSAASNDDMTTVGGRVKQLPVGYESNYIPTSQTAYGRDIPVGFGSLSLHPQKVLNVCYETWLGGSGSHQSQGAT